MPMALLLYGYELRQAHRAAAEQTKAQERAALRSSALAYLALALTQAPAPAGYQPVATKVERRHRHHREDSLLAMLNRPQVRVLNMYYYVVLLGSTMYVRV